MAGRRDSVSQTSPAAGRAGDNPPSGLRFAAMVSTNQQSQSVNLKRNWLKFPELSLKEREQNWQRADAVLRRNSSRRRLNSPTPKGRLLGGDAVLTPPLARFPAFRQSLAGCSAAIRAIATEHVTGLAVDPQLWQRIRKAKKNTAHPG